MGRRCRSAARCYPLQHATKKDRPFDGKHLTSSAERLGKSQRRTNGLHVVRRLAGGPKEELLRPRLPLTGAGDQLDQSRQVLLEDHPAKARREPGGRRNVSERAFLFRSGGIARPASGACRRIRRGPPLSRPGRP